MMKPAIRLKRCDVEHLRVSTQRKGFASLSSALDADSLRALRAEAARLACETSRAEQRAGVRYRAGIAPLGPRALGVLRSRQVDSLLCRVFGRRYVLSEERSCLTRYEEGDHLGAHRDEPAGECTVTVIVYLEAKARRCATRTGLELRVYGRTLASHRRPRLVIPTRAGTLVVGRGSRYWHERPTMSKGERVVALTACYRRAGP